MVASGSVGVAWAMVRAREMQGSRDGAQACTEACTPTRVANVALMHARVALRGRQQGFAARTSAAGAPAAAARRRHRPCGVRFCTCLQTPGSAAGRGRGCRLLAGSLRRVLRPRRLATRGGLVAGLCRRSHAVSAPPHALRLSGRCLAQPPGIARGCSGQAKKERGHADEGWLPPRLYLHACAVAGAAMKRLLLLVLIVGRIAPVFCSYVVFTEIFMKKCNGECS